MELLRPALHILLEATPEDIDLAEVRRHLMELPEVTSVHDLHAWTLTSSLPILTAHVVVTDECFTTGEAGRVLDHLQDCLAGHFDVAHSTLQFESAGHIEHELGGHRLIGSSAGPGATRAATSSTCSVMGKMSKARSTVRRQPSSSRTRTSRPNEAGSHDT